MAIDVPPSYYDHHNKDFVNKTNGEPSPPSQVDGMLKYIRTQPKAEPFTPTNRESNVPAKYYNEAFVDDNFRDSTIPSNFNNKGYEDDEYITVSPSRSVPSTHDKPKTLRKCNSLCVKKRIYG